MSQAGSNSGGSGPGDTDLHAPLYIVGTIGKGANYTTIGAAVTAAAASGVNSTIFIQPGTYTENLTLPAGISLTAFSCDGYQNVMINGQILCTATNPANQNILSGLYLSTSGGNFLAVTGVNTCEVKLINCFLAASSGTGINLANPNASIYCIDCQGNISNSNILFNVSNSQVSSFILDGLVFINCQFSNSDATTAASLVSGGAVIMINSLFLFPIITSGTGSIMMRNSTIDTTPLNSIALTVGGSGTNNAYNSVFISSAKAGVQCDSTFTMSNCVVNSTNPNNAVSGAGILNYSTIDFPNSGDLITTTTQNSLVVQAGSVVVNAAFAESYVHVTGNTAVGLGNCIIGVNSSAPCTMTMPTPSSGQFRGQIWTIKDESGDASGNNITIDGNGVDIDGAPTFVMANNYGSVTLYWSPTLPQYYII